jgi:hypothetical protein
MRIWGGIWHPRNRAELKPGGKPVAGGRGDKSLNLYKWAELEQSFNVYYKVMNPQG